MVLALLLGICATASGALQPLLVATMVDGFTGAVPTSMIAVLLALLVVGALLTGVQQLVLQRSGEQFAFDRRKRLIQHLFALPIGVLGRRDRGDLVSRVTTDVAQTRAVLSSGLVEMATSLVAVLVSIVMMATLDWVLLLLAAAAIAIVLVAVTLLGRRTRPAGLRLQEAVGELAGTVSRALGSMKTIRSTGSARREADAAIENAEKARQAGFSTATLRAAIQVFTGVTVQLLLIAVVAVGALRVAAGALSVGQLSAFIMYLMLLVAPIMMFASVVSLLGEALGALSRVTALEELEPERDIQRAAGDGDGRPSGPEHVRPTVFELRNVGFRYDAGDAGVLHDLTLSFAEGTTTAIVGPSGAGKTTLFDLLDRFYEPSEGVILFRGRDVQSISREELRSEIAYVEQDAPALSGTIRDNLLLGAHTATDDEIIRALTRVNLAPPDGSWAAFLDQQVGEVGSFLSGGERQRLAIARALVAGSKILLLDEVTSNLDSNNERIVQDLLHDEREDRTIIVIAHRLSTVIAADSIALISEGRLSARGTHGELLTTSPLYRELAHNQLLD
jgi:ATP-binding cassette subfamily B protein